MRRCKNKNVKYVCVKFDIIRRLKKHTFVERFSFVEIQCWLQNPVFWLLLFKSAQKATKTPQKNPHFSFSEAGWLASIKHRCCRGNGSSGVIGGWRCPAASRLEDSHWTSPPVSHNALHDAAAQASIPLWMWPNEEVGSTRSNRELFSVCTWVKVRRLENNNDDHDIQKKTLFLFG